MKRKVVLLGDSAVGKTSLIRRFVFDQFEDTYILTIGSKVTKKQLRIARPNGTVDLTMMVWDLLGREGYRAFHARTFAGVHGAVLVADLTRRETLDSLERYWIPSLFQVVENVPLVFAANKADLEGDRAFEPEAMAAMASRFNVGLEDFLPGGLAAVHATSAKTGDNVERAFEALGHLMLAGRRPEDPVRDLYESLLARQVGRSADTTTAIGALDAILVDFVESFGDPKLAMMVLRQEVVRAGVDVRRPHREGLLKVVDYLAEAEHDRADREAVVRNRERRLGWVLRVREP